MNDEIRKFDFKGAALRTLTDKDGEPWFVAKDVCDILGMSNNRDAISQLDDDEKNTVVISDGIPGNPNKTIISEPGLYKLIMRSRKTEAKEFQRWVTHEVLPRIRRTGGYIPTSDMDDDMTILAKAVMIGQRTMEEQKRRIAEQQSRIDELQPKARFADAVTVSGSVCLVGQLAKVLRQNGLDIGQNRLFDRLRQEGFLGKTGRNTNMPTQKAVEMGLFKVKESVRVHSDGHTTSSFTPLVTGKGQVYFINRFCKQGVLDASK